MATQYDPIAKDESLNTTEQSPRNIADVLAAELVGIKNAISGGGGSGGHTIISPDGTSMTQRAGLSFTDAHVSDNSGDDSTDVSLVQEITDANWALLDPTDESNNGFYQIGNSPLLHLGYVGNGEKKDFDAGAQSDYVEVVADGVKTYGGLMDELHSLIDQSRMDVKYNFVYMLSPNGGEAWFKVYYAKNGVIYAASSNTSTSGMYSDTLVLRSSGSNVFYYSNGNHDNSSVTASNGTKYRYYYNDAHTFDFNTKAENCLYGNGNVKDVLDDLRPHKKDVSVTTNANGSASLVLSSDYYVTSVFTSSGYKCVPFLYNGNWYISVFDTNGTTMSAVVSTTMSVTVIYQKMP